MIKLTTLQIRKLAEFAGLTVHVDPELTNDEYCVNELNNGALIVWNEDAPETEVTTLEK